MPNVISLIENVFDKNFGMLINYNTINDNICKLIKKSKAENLKI